MRDVIEDKKYRPVKVRWSGDFMRRTAHERTMHRLSLTSLTDEEKVGIYQTLYELEIKKIQRQM